MVIISLTLQVLHLRFHNNYHIRSRFFPLSPHEGNRSEEGVEDVRRM